MDYHTRYGLEFNPFLKNSKEVIVNTNEYKEVLYRLDFLAKTRGFGVLTGASGNGKTTFVRNWIKSLSPSLYKVVYVTLTTLTAYDFYRQLVRGLGVEPAFRKPDNFRIIQEEISRIALEKKKTAVIIIDEANYISHSILNDLKMLFNFEMDSKDRAVLLLVGLPKLNNSLNLTVNEPLKQRIIMNYNIEGIPKEEGRTYISEKLKGAGCEQQIFEDGAIEAILNASNGTPRLINKYCNASMLIGNNEKVSLITRDIVMKAISNCELV